MKIMVAEFSNDDAKIFDKIISMLQTQENCEIELISKDNSSLSFLGWEIFPDNRNICYNGKEMDLTTKEFELFCLLASNRGKIIPYDKIYNIVWGDMAFGAEKNAISCQIRNIRKKIKAIAPNSHISIRCERNIGYQYPRTAVWEYTSG